MGLSDRLHVCLKSPKIGDCEGGWFDNVINFIYLPLTCGTGTLVFFAVSPPFCLNLVLQTFSVMVLKIYLKLAMYLYNERVLGLVKF